MEKLFSNLADSYNGTFSSFHEYPSIDDRKAYMQLDAELKLALVQNGEQFIDFTYPTITATDFMAFTRTGNRVDYENKYFAKRKALNALVLAECVEDKGRFMDSIINGIFSICEETSWVLPPHNSYLRNTPQLVLPDATRPVLDLFACETGALLATIHYLLASRLQAVCEFIPTNIELEIERRIYIPYIHEHFWWMGKDDEPMCNWTIWCTQNVLITAFFMEVSNGFRKAVLHRAALSCDYFLKDYGEDGCCDEGAQYYKHAGLCLFNTLEILNGVTDSHFSSLYENTKIRNIAAYIVNVHVADDYYINFADCSAKPGHAGVREYLFGLRTNNPSMAGYAAKDYQLSTSKLSIDELDINLFYSLQSVFTHREIMNYNTAKLLQPKDCFYSSVGVFISRSSSFCLAAKAGDNDDSHNHNDTGSFTVFKDAKPVFIDVGVESYTKKTFSPKRYEIWTMQSCYHNLPTINNYDELDGTDYHASAISTKFTNQEASIRMNIASAYPAEACVDSYIREITLSKKENMISITDIFDSSRHSVIINLMTYEKPRMKDQLLQIGSLATATVGGATLLAIEEIPVTDERLKLAWNHNLYRIRLQVTSNIFTLQIR